MIEDIIKQGAELNLRLLEQEKEMMEDDEPASGTDYYTG